MLLMLKKTANEMPYLPTFGTRLRNLNVFVYLQG